MNSRSLNHLPAASPLRQLAAFMASDNGAGVVVTPTVGGSLVVTQRGDRMHAANAAHALELLTQPSVPQEKRLENARARAALLGVALLVTDDDRGAPLFVATTGALTKSFGALADVETWLFQIGGMP